MPDLLPIAGFILGAALLWWGCATSDDPEQPYKPTRYTGPTFNRWGNEVRGLGNLTGDLRHV